MSSLTIRALLSIICCLSFSFPPLAADENSEKVSLILTMAKAVEGGDSTQIECEIKLINDTGEELSVASNFSSAFDSLAVTVTDLDGKTLKQQYQSFHQSPFSPDKERTFSLAKGKTTANLVFPITNVGKAGDRIKVRLVGFLPRSSCHSLLSTETKTVEITQSN